MAEDKAMGLHQWFEDALRRGKNPQIEAYLEQEDARLRPDFLRWLISREIAHDVQRGSTPCAYADYIRRFPSYPEVVLDAYVKSEEQFLIGDYLVIREVGAGGMGRVLEAKHCTMDRKAALKFCRHLQRDLQRFEREIKTLAKLSHPNLMAAYDAREIDGLPFFVMEYVDGNDLGKADVPLSVETAIDYIIQAAKGLEYAHKEGVIHRDIKPANLLVDGDGTLKVADLGLARELGPEYSGPLRLTETSQIMGTPGYMCPEQRENTHDVDRRCDIYSLGCVLYYLITGEDPRILQQRDRPSLVAERSDIPQEVDAVFQRMVAKDRDRRYQSMTEVLSGLQALAREDSGPSFRYIEIDLGVERVARQSTALGIRLVSDRKPFVIGDRISILVRVSSECDLFLFDIDFACKPARLFPNDFQPQPPRLQAGHQYSFPEMKYSYGMALGGPAGIETVIALALDPRHDNESRTFDPEYFEGVERPISGEQILSLLPREVCERVLGIAHLDFDVTEPGDCE